MAETSVRIPVLTREGNYKAWAASMRAYLVTLKRLDRLLDNPPAADDERAEELDIQCRSRLLLQVAGPLQDIVERASTAHEAWQALHDDYKGSLLERQPLVMADLMKLQQGSDTITRYVDRAKSLRDEFLCDEDRVMRIP